MLRERNHWAVVSGSNLTIVPTRKEGKVPLFTILYRAFLEHCNNSASCSTVRACPTAAIWSANFMSA